MGVPRQGNLILRIVCGIIIIIPLFTRLYAFIPTLYIVWGYLGNENLSIAVSYYGSIIYGYIIFLILAVVTFPLGYLLTGILVIIKRYKYIKFSIPIIGLGILSTVMSFLIYNSMEDFPIFFSDVEYLFDLAYIIFVTILCFVNKSSLIKKCKWILWIVPVIIFIINTIYYATQWYILSGYMFIALVDCLAEISIGVVVVFLFSSHKSPGRKIMFCEECGTQLGIEMNYCDKCGTKVIDS